MTAPRIGVLGGGQLAQMLTLAGYPLGISVTSFDASESAPAGLVGPLVANAMDNGEQLRRRTSRCDVLTYEWENLPVELVADLAEARPVHPSPLALATAQDRWHEKRLFAELEIPIAPFRLATTPRDIEVAFSEIGKMVAKTRTGGYDGKGQATISSPDDFAEANQLLEHGDVFIEQWVPFEREVSIIGVRGIDGEVRSYPLTQNVHRDGILAVSTAPAPAARALQATAERYVRAILDRLDYVGVLALELFAIGDRLLANEMAPRVHNSGHWTIEGAETSQFENHLRAIAGLPLGSCHARGPSAMVNIIGTAPSLEELLKLEGAHVHLYGKSPRPGRKLGHVTVVAPDPTALANRVAAVQAVVDRAAGTD